MDDTPSQAAAIQCDKNLMMFAGPGAGKTKTSVRKAVRVLSDPKRSLLMCTFTRDAAQEMQQRLESEMEAQGYPKPSADRLRVSTLDSLCLWHYKLNVSDRFKLLSPQAQYPRLRQICAEFGLGDLDDHIQNFDAYQATHDREVLSERLQQESPHSWTLIKHYHDYLESCNMLDLASIKRHVALGIENGTVPLFPFTDMVVDEAQDCDELQLLIATVHGQNDVVTTLVGDDDQTIYDWRAACGYKGMVKFVQECGAEVVRLAENFRSKQEIVEHATNLIRYNNPNRVDKNQTAIRGPGGEVGACYQKDVLTEAEWIAGHIAKNHQAPYSVAVLARTNIDLDAIETALNGAGIPSHRAGKSLWDREDIAAYLSLMLFMCKGSADLLSSALGLLGFKSVSVNAIMKELSSHHIRFRRGHGLDLPELDPEESKLITLISSCMGKWRANVKEGEIELVIYESTAEFASWYSMLSAKPKRDGSENKKLTSHKKGMESVQRALLRIKGDLKGRLRLLTKKRREEPDPSVVRLMTMHGSKGLEWDHVYLIGCEENDRHTSVTEGPSERRVFFVGMTRARESLWITFGGKTPIFLLEAQITNILKAPEPELEGIDVGCDDKSVWDD